MNYQQTGSASIGVSSSPQISPATLHNSFDSATQRLAALVQQSGKIAERLNRGQNGEASGPGKPPSVEPNLTDKIDGFHALLTALEINMGFIGGNIG